MFLPHSTEFMSFKEELWVFLSTMTTSSPHMLLQGHQWLYLHWDMRHESSDPDPLTQHTAHLTPTTHSPTCSTSDAYHPMYHPGHEDVLWIVARTYCCQAQEAQALLLLR
jgi:hypothetical protein